MWAMLLPGARPTGWCRRCDPERLHGDRGDELLGRLSVITTCTVAPACVAGHQLGNLGSRRYRHHPDQDVAAEGGWQSSCTSPEDGSQTPVPQPQAAPQTW